MARLLGYLGRQSRSYLLLLGFVLVILVGLLDYLTGPEISFSIFYLIPVCLVAWLVGRSAGIVMSITGALSWLIADLLSGHVYSRFTIPYWNAAVRLGFFLIVTYAATALRAARERQEELGQLIVHDLRAPLSNVMTGLQTLQDIAGEAMDTVQKNLVKLCIASCNRMSTLINSLLDLARLESGQMPLQLSETSVKDLVESSLGQVALWAEHSHVTLTSQLEPDVERVCADPVVTERALVNLLGNAIKFSRPDSTVTINVTRPTHNEVAFSVADQGWGIPREWMGRVFDKFAQVEAGRMGSKVGSGLGLAFCRLAVEAQGGRIWLESAVGEGTTVTFTLPVSPR
jgi:signal transduction histidine kinase